MKIKDALHIFRPPLEVRILLAHASGFSPEYLIGHSDEELSNQVYTQFLSLVERRKNHEPIAYIIGKKEFYGRDFKVTKDVLIPRPDSETLIDTVLKFSRDDVSILELGIGSGCLLITLLMELPVARGFGVDISPRALEIACQNASSYGLQDRCKFVRSNWFENVKGKFDVIVSNPPYITEDERAIMAVETLKFEPARALFGGLEPYRIIAFNAHEFLNENGKIYVEIGAMQELDIEEIFLSNGYNVLSKHHDIENRMRVMAFALDTGPKTGVSCKGSAML